MRSIVAALALLAAAPAAAQPPSGQSAVPAELLVPSEEARSFFETVQSNTLTDEILERALQAPSGSIRQIDETIERMLTLGDPIPGWRNLGIDIRAIVASRDGGLTGNMTEGMNHSDPSFAYYVDRPIESFVSSSWLLIGRRGAAFAGENIEVDITRLSPKVVLVERIAYRREGNAYCRAQAESRLYADPAVAASQADIISSIFAMRLLAAIERVGVCEVAEDVGGGEYRIRLFDPNGHPHTTLEQRSPRARIVASRPFPGVEPSQ